MQVDMTTKNRKQIVISMFFRDRRYFSIFRNIESVSVFKNIAISVSISINLPTSSR